MADAATSVNGMYGSQYSQPAELAASTPSAPAHAPSASQSTTASTGAQKADPQEIGWYFVEQYYTTLSKSPERIHLFYNKKSQLVSGVEAEKVIPAVGAKAISEKIKSLDISDCKVRVLNVDSQASFNNIVVQVIGEMSNKNQPHHKFCQTFVLAEQPNGYFVLNDIFRYLSDDEDEVVEDGPAQPEAPLSEPQTPIDPSAPVPGADEVVDNPATTAEVDEKLEEVRDEEPVAEPASVNGQEESPAEEPVAAEQEPDAVEEVTPEVAAEAPPEAPASEQLAQPAEESSPPKAATPAPEAPAAKKTWASMLGGGAKAQPAVPALPTQPTGPTVAKPTRPTQQVQSQAPAAGDIAAPSEAATTSTTTQSNGWQMAGDGKKKGGPQAKEPENTLAYIKNVNDKVDARLLREALERHGELKYFDVSRPRNCAFVEFATSEGYKAAVAANPHQVGSEQITVEERKPKIGAYGGANSTFPRGNGAPARGRGGNMQQRTGSQGGFPKDAGRGAFQQRGNKSGNVTPRGGRGQAQAA